MPTSDQDVLSWLRKFEAACRGRDFDAGRLMFAQDAVAFDPKPVVRTNGDTAWIAVGWQSEATGPDGKAFARPGRATFILAHRDGRWQCVHSHVSLQPTQSESVHGRLGA